MHQWAWVRFTVLALCVHLVSSPCLLRQVFSESCSFPFCILNWNSNVNMFPSISWRHPLKFNAFALFGFAGFSAECYKLSKWRMQVVIVKKFSIIIYCCILLENTALCYKLSSYVAGNYFLPKGETPALLGLQFIIVGLTQMFWWKSRIVAIFLLFLILLHVLT